MPQSIFIPPYWLYNTDRSLSSQLAIFDFDGVLANNSPRRRSLDPVNPDWEKYFRQVDEDLPIRPLTTLSQSIKKRLDVVILTGRPLRSAPLSRKWLEKHHVNYQLLIVRPDKDYIPAPQFKKQEILRLINLGHSIEFALDDEAPNIKIYQELNIPNLQILSAL